MSDTSNEFLGFFLDEALDILSVWEKACLELERTDSIEAKDELYRSAHNLKSGSGAVGLTAFNELVHRVEDLIAKVLAGHLTQNPAIIKVLLGTHSLLFVWIEKLKAGSSFAPLSETQRIYSELEAILRGGSIPAQAAAAAVLDPTEPAAHPVALLVQSIGELSRDEAEPKTGAPLSPSPLPQGPPLQQLESKTVASTKSQESIRVAATKLDHLIQLIGELSTQQAIVWHARQNAQMQSPSCDIAVQLIQKIAKDLQGLALSLRLQPLQSLFQRLERTACDLARTQEKKLEVIIRGDYVEVDRTVIERISDAMNHVIRNAVDHGIETPLERQKAQKREIATLHLEAAQETNGVMITIIDDGRGLNTERIQQKAIERGIIRPDQKLKPSEIQRLIFHAGLSTAEKVTDISGRGVGMDVVKNAVETIGGTIQVSSQAQVGTSFAISLPATLSIIDALIIALDGSRYAVPLQDVAEIINTEQSRIEAVSGFGRLLSLRDQLIPVEALHEHLPPRLAKPLEGALEAPRSEDSMVPALIVRRGEEALAFEVSAILGQQPVTVRRLPPSIALITGYSGGTILGDGDPCVILNLNALVSRYFERKSSATLNEDHPGPRTELAEDPDQGIENRFLIFETHGHKIGAPLLSVKEVLSGLRCEPMVGAAPHLIGCIEVRGVLVPVYDLGIILGLTQKTAAESLDIVLEDGDATFAVRIQRLSAVADVKILPSSITDKQHDIVPGLHGYLGSGLHRDQTILLINLQNALKQWETRAQLSTSHLSHLSHSEAS